MSKEAVDRLREKAQNEQTVFALNDLLRAADKRIADLEQGEAALSAALTMWEERCEKLEAQLAAREQSEPVGEIGHSQVPGMESLLVPMVDAVGLGLKAGTKLYTHPEPRKLSDEEIIDAAVSAGVAYKDEGDKITCAWNWNTDIKNQLLQFARAILSAAGAPEDKRDAERWPLIQLGHGKVEVAEGQFASLPALIFGKNGTGVIGEATQPDRYHEEGETLAVITFGNAACLDVVQRHLSSLRAKSFSANPAAIAAMQKEGE